MLILLANQTRSLWIGLRSRMCRIGNSSLGNILCQPVGCVSVEHCCQSHIVITYYILSSPRFEGFFFFFLVPIVFKALSFCDDLLNYGSHFSRGSYMSNGHQSILLGTERSKTDGKVSYRSLKGSTHPFYKVSVFSGMPGNAF